MTSLESVLAFADLGPVEVEVFGTTEPAGIAALLSSLVTVATGANVRGGRWYTSSVAAVAGVVLDDGREIVVRTYGRAIGTAFVEGVVRVQRHLARHGFCCPEPLSGLVSVAGVHGRVESLLDDPGARRPAPHEMAASARGLAQVIRLAGEIDPTGLSEHPMRIIDSELYPTPHSPLFDFEATAAGAEWIDDIAMAARGPMSDDPPVIAHGDWSARNVRLDTTGVGPVYDWESLQHGPETIAVGIAAATWQALGEADEPLAPTAPNINRYIDLYEHARERPLTVSQHRSARAAALYALAYTARCEHAITPGGPLRTRVRPPRIRPKRTPLATELDIDRAASGEREGHPPRT